MSAQAGGATETGAKKRVFRTFTYRGVELEKLLDLPMSQLLEMFNARQRRKFSRGIGRKTKLLLQKLIKAKKACPKGEKPACVKTHLRDTVIVPEMIGSIVGVYNGKTFVNVEIKPEMIGHYFGEFSITYKPFSETKLGSDKTFDPNPNAGNIGAYK